MKYNIGLDLGIGSVGWSVIGIDEANNPTHIVDANVLLVNSMEDRQGNLASAKRRGSRGTRRLIRRKAHRIKRVKSLIKSDLGILPDNEFYSNLKIDVYETKAKGLHERLLKEELAIILVHYVKHRGFKSNRKKPTEGNKEDGKLLEGISKLRVELEGKGLMPSEYLYQRVLAGKNVRNHDTYEIVFERSAIKREAEEILQKQIEFGVCSQEFADKYIKIFESQRDFSDGPGGESKWKVDFAKLYGKCNFRKDEYRASKACPSFEVFRALQRITNERFLIKDEYTEVSRKGEMILTPKKGKFTKDEIKQIYNKALSKSKMKFTYDDLIKMFGSKYEFNIEISKKGYIDAIKAYKKSVNISDDVRVDVNDGAHIDGFRVFLDKEKGKKDFIEFKQYWKIANSLKNELGDEFHNLSIEQLDDIATGLSYYRTDERLKQYFQKEADLVSEVAKFDYTNKEIEAFLTLDVNSDTSSLSLSLIQDLNKLLFEGFEYTVAMEKLGYDHSKVDRNVEKKEYLPNLEQILEIYPNEMSNPRVNRVVGRTMKVINEIIKKYGRPYNIHVESARDIANIQSKRNEINFSMLSNFDRNVRLKNEIVEKYPHMFTNAISVSKDDVIKYRLYREQKGICLYTGEKIKENALFTNDYQIDHIVPYSRCYDDTYKNKTLTTTAANTAKTNKTPLEYFNGKKDELETFKERLSSNIYISKSKKNMYLAEEISTEFKDRSLNDTRFINQYVKTILEDNLIIDGKIKFYNGTVVNNVKKLWGIAYLTHSIENENYSRKLIYNVVEAYCDDNKITVKLKSRVPNPNINAIGELIHEFKLEEKKVKNQSEEEIENYNDRIVKLFENKSEVVNKLYDLKKLELDDAYESVKKDDSYAELVRESVLFALSEIYSTTKKDEMKKNRNNHLHHALDAVAVAMMNDSTFIKMTNYLQAKEYKKTGCDDLLINPETGEVIDSDLDKLRNELQPYPNFLDEVKYRIYELDAEKQKELFDKYFNDGYERSIRPLFPVKERVDRTGGSLHKETIYGKDKQLNMLTKRVSVANLKLSDFQKDGLWLEWIKDPSRKPTYDAICEWLKNKKTEYPVLPNGNFVKKVEIRAMSSDDKAIKISEDKYAEVDKVVAIDLYKSKSGIRNNIHVFQRNNFNINQEDNYNRNATDFSCMISWGGSKNYEIIQYSDLCDKYLMFGRLYPGDLIQFKKIVKSKEDKAAVYTGYLVGYTGGLLEISSIVGDQLDFIDSGLFSGILERTRVSISTIQSIRKVNIDVLGY